MQSDAPITLRTRKFITNRLLARKQFVLDVLHPNRPNVSRAELSEKLAAMYKADAARVVCFGFKTVFGGGRSTGFALIYDDEASQKKFEPRHRLVRVRSSGLCIGYWHAADMPSPFDPSSVRPCRQGREGLAQAPQGAQEPVQEGPRHQEGQGGRAGEEEVKGGRPPSSLRLFDWHGRLSHACARRFDRALHAGAPLAGGRSGDLNGTKKEWEDREGWSSGRLTMMMVSQSRCLTRLGYSRAEWCARYGQRRRRMSQYDTGGDPARENGA